MIHSRSISSPIEIPTAQNLLFGEMTPEELYASSLPAISMPVASLDKLENDYHTFLNLKRDRLANEVQDLVTKNQCLQSFLPQLKEIHKDGWNKVISTHLQHIYIISEKISTWIESYQAFKLTSHKNPDHEFNRCFGKILIIDEFLPKIDQLLTQIRSVKIDDDLMSYPYNKLSFRDHWVKRARQLDASFENHFIIQPSFNSETYDQIKALSEQKKQLSCQMAELEYKKVQDENQFTNQCINLKYLFYMQVYRPVNKRVKTLTQHINDEFKKISEIFCKEMKTCEREILAGKIEQLHLLANTSRILQAGFKEFFTIKAEAPYLFTPQIKKQFLAAITALPATKSSSLQSPTQPSS